MASLAVVSPGSVVAPLDQKSYAKIPTVLDVPNLIQLQTASFEWFKGDCLRTLFEEISPIQDFTGGRFELNFTDHVFHPPKYTEEECRDKEVTYSAPLYVKSSLLIKETGEIKEQNLFMGDIPMMTSQGTFIINGAERVVVSQLVRSPGVYLTVERDVASDRDLCAGKLIPYRGAWLEFETSNRDVLSVKVDRKRKAPLTTLLRALGLVSEDELLTMFQDVDNDPTHQYIRSTLERDTHVLSQEEALLEFYRRLRPGEPPNVENARNLMENLFFNPRRYDLGKVGRYKLNRRLGINVGPDQQNITKDDLVAVVRKMILVNNGLEPPDDIDHLGNRRIRAVGELLQNGMRVGLLRMERVIRERMTTQPDPTQVTPGTLINVRPVVAAVREFFGGSQLSQFMDQTNPLAELTHKRRLSALGPGGLSRERAGFDVRDVHHSHYGRICPIETPEGPNIGLLGSLATYARTNQFGFIETPYRRVVIRGAQQLPRPPGAHNHRGRGGRRGQGGGTQGPDRFGSAGKAARRPGAAAGEGQAVRLIRSAGHPLPGRGRGGALPHRPGQFTPGSQEPVHHGQGGSQKGRDIHHGASNQRGVHGHLAHSDCERVRGADTLPGARRRHPRAHGFQHAAPGGATPCHGGPAGRNRHGGQGGQGQRTGCAHQERRRCLKCVRQPHRGDGRGGQR